MGRPTTPLINRDHAIETALEIVDSLGLDALTMRKLAEHLDVNVASLYHHFQGKDDLLQGVCELIYREVPFPDARTERWTDLVVRTSSYLREVMLTHPNVVPVMARFHPRQVMPEIYERLGELLMDLGVPSDMVDVLSHAFDAFVIGSVTMSREVHREANGHDLLLSPRLQGWKDANARTEDEEFLLTCRSLADGLAAYIASSGAAPRERR